MATTALFGDSSPSSLPIDFFSSFRVVLDRGVEIVLAADRLRREQLRATQVTMQAGAELDRLERLRRFVVVSLSDRGSPVADHGSCTARIAEAAARIVEDELALVRGACDAELADSARRVANERAYCWSLVAALLRAHDLSTSQRLQLSYAPTGPRVELAAASPFGIEWQLHLEVPTEHALARPLRVNRVVEDLDLRVGGLALAKMNVIGLVRDEAGRGSLRLASAGARPAVVAVHVEDGELSISASDERGAPAPIRASARDADRLRALFAAIAGSVAELRSRPGRLTALRLDGAAFADIDDPSKIVARIIRALAPVLTEIARRSPSASELVLKRPLGDGRREELFASKEEFLRRLDPVPPAYRALFEPLGLDDIPSIEVQVPSPRQPAIASPSPPRRAVIGQVVPLRAVK